MRKLLLAYSGQGSALEALPHMHNLLNARPDGFDSIEEAVEWQWVHHPPLALDQNIIFNIPA
jgi:hypothetical protein